MPIPFLPEARLMRTLSHPGRLAILESLRDGKACVCHLTAVLRRPQAYLSQQLAILRGAGLIEAQRDRAFTYYHLRDHRVLRLLEQAGHLTGGPTPRAAVATSRPAACACPQCRSAAAPPRGKSA